jgi:hypothetical protein
VFFARPTGKIVSGVWLFENCQECPLFKTRTALVMLQVVMVQKQLSPTRHWKNRRRSQRLVLRVPVVAYRSRRIGSPFSEGTHTLVVSAHGALISLTAKVAADQRLVLKHAVSGEEQECRVVFTRKNMAGPTEVGIEFLQPAPNFWHIAFPPVIGCVLTKSMESKSEHPCYD